MGDEWCVKRPQEVQAEGKIWVATTKGKKVDVVDIIDCVKVKVSVCLYCETDCFLAVAELLSDGICLNVA